MQHSILGDPVYGGRHRGDTILPTEVRQALTAAGRQMLHAWRLSFRHPVNKQEMRFEAALPEDMRHILALLATQPSEEVH
jgi:23S rRNA pseudouridine1911/1915/1917 synthase